MLGLLTGVVASGCAPHPVNTTHPPQLTCADCRAALPVNGWCTVCEIGYVAAVRIRSHLMHEMLDAHGHDITDWTHDCLDCAERIETDGFCSLCGFGFVDGKLYFTALTWSLGLGLVIDLAANDCAVCRDRSAGSWWCDECRRGIVGNVAFTDEKKFERAQTEYRRLVAALTSLERCEACAISQFQGIECPDCRARERAGE